MVLLVVYVMASALTAGFGFVVRNWIRKRRRQRACFHHTLGPDGKSCITSRLIDLGCRKMFWCTLCDQSWFT